MSNRDADYLELYDIVADPLEKTDLKDGKPEVVKELLGKIGAWKASLPGEADGSCFSEERGR